MEANTLFINEDYVKKYSSHNSTLDTNKIVALIRRVQMTFLPDLISSELYLYLHNKVDTDPNSLTAGEKSLFQQIMLFMAIKVNVLYSLESPDRGSNEGWDRSINSLNHEIKIVESRIIRLINANEILLAIANTSTQNEFISNELGNGLGGFYFE